MICTGLILIDTLIRDSCISNFFTFSFISFSLQKAYSYLMIKFYLYQTLSKLFPLIVTPLSVENKMGKDVDFENINDGFASIKDRRIDL